MANRCAALRVLLIAVDARLVRRLHCAERRRSGRGGLWPGRRSDIGRRALVHGYAEQLAAESAARRGRQHRDDVCDLEPQDSFQRSRIAHDKRPDAGGERRCGRCRSSALATVDEQPRLHARETHRRIASRRGDGGRRRSRDFVFSRIVRFFSCIIDNHGIDAGLAGATGVRGASLIGVTNTCSAGACDAFFTSIRCDLPCRAAGSARVGSGGQRRRHPSSGDGDGGLRRDLGVVRRGRDQFGVA
jgi:hypothetical protein